MVNGVSCRKDNYLRQLVRGIIDAFFLKAKFEQLCALLTRGIKTPDPACGN